MVNSQASNSLIFFLCCLSLLATYAKGATEHIAAENTTSEALVEEIDPSYPPPTWILAHWNESSTHRTRRGSGKALGFVTPWHPSGRTLIEKYRDKFDYAAPVWYSIKVVAGEDGGMSEYQLGGAPPTSEDEEWYQRIQAPSVLKGSGDHPDRPLAPVKVFPRFLLDGWGPNDLAELAGSREAQEKWIDAIMDEVSIRNYDGVVLETGGIWALTNPVISLSKRLRRDLKDLIVVLAPLSGGAELFVADAEGEKDNQRHQQLNKLLLESVQKLHQHVLHFTVMTYDHAAAGGHPLDISRPPSANPVPQDSVLRSPRYLGVRVPSSNTPLDWLRGNVEMMSNVMRGIDEIDMMGAWGDDGNEATAKLLMGIACYGYTYPLGWLNIANGNGVVRKPPLAPIRVKDLLASAQADARSTAEAKAQRAPYADMLGVLRAPGRPLVHSSLLEVLKGRPLVRKDDASEENLIEYIDFLDEEGEKDKERKDKTLAFWRAYFPSAHTVRRRLEALHDVGPEVGISLWDVGQAGDWLLDAL